MSEARISAGSCAAAPITAALSFSAYGGVVVAKISACTSPGGAALSASRAASTAIETLSSSKLAIARSPLPAGVPRTAAIADRLSRRYGTYEPQETIPAMTGIKGRGVRRGQLKPTTSPGFVRTIDSVGIADIRGGASIAIRR